MHALDDDLDSGTDSAFDWLQGAIADVLAAGKKIGSLSEAETLAEAPKTPTGASLAAQADERSRRQG